LRKGCLSALIVLYLRERARLPSAESKAMSAINSQFLIAPKPLKNFLFLRIAFDFAVR
jgi:hypothetical protein